LFVPGNLAAHNGYVTMSSISAAPPHLSVVIPTFNEARRLPATLERIQTFLLARGVSAEILIIADGSTDGTAALVDAMAVSPGGIPLRVLVNPVNHGKGYAVAQGVFHARGERILMTDADLSTPIQELDRLTGWLDRGWKVAIGSRVLPGPREVRRSGRRVLVTRVFNWLVSRIALSGFSDTQCGFKLFESEAARTIFSRLTIDRFAFDVEVLAIAKILDLPVTEVPVAWYEDPDSRVHLLRDSLGMIRDLLRIRAQLRTKAYLADSSSREHNVSCG
jgi:dolichyl-phosphate beta-glucosyltransferase